MRGLRSFSANFGRRLRPEIQRTHDFERIQALPRRSLSEQEAQQWADLLTPELTCPGSGAKLRPWQALALAEAVENHGAWLALPVGLGKTLISFLLPRLMHARRPVLIVPASLKDKTRADFASYVGAWKTPNPPARILTLQELAPERGAKILSTHKPDLIMIDEADELSNRASSAARRIDRYVVDSDVAVVAMTGTPSRKSIMGYVHLLAWALRERAPVPMREGEALLWAAALDETGRRFGPRPHPGPLGHDLKSARAWFKQRLAQTPGVVIVDGDSCAMPLTIRVRLAQEDSVLDTQFERFMREQENPDGQPVSDPLSRWRIDGQLGCGYFTKYVAPGPPEAWREARRNVARFVRQTIERSSYLDTEAQVLRRFPEHPTVVVWREISPTYEPVTEAVWLSTSVIQSARAWLEESAEPGIVWCGGVEFAKNLAIAARLKYFGREGKDQNGLGLHRAPPERSMVVSWHANKKGFNLQAWARQLIVHPPQSAKWFEQIFGRSHRSGQTRPVVVDVLATSGGTLDSFEAAIAEAKFAGDTVGLTQKVLRADIQRTAPTKTHSNRFRWARKEK
jgi:hypothetical protein